MKTLANFIITAATLTLLAACTNTQKPAGADPHAGHQHEAAEEHTEEAKKAVVMLKDDQLNAVYQHYIHLSTALVNGDAAEAKIAASAIELGAKGLVNGRTLSAIAGKIVNAADLEQQRVLYADLSNDFITRVKSSGLKSGELYVEYCPMALNDKGAFWLSNQKAIRNPYFGESMLTCGEVKETIK